MKRWITSPSLVLTSGILLGTVISASIVLTASADVTNCVPAPSGLVSWWRAEGSAGDSVDSNNGALLNGASFAPGMVGPAFSFDGGNQCVQVPFAPSLVASNYSIEAWVKPLAQVSDFINQDLIFGQNYGHCQLVARTGTTGVRIAFQFGVSHFTFYGAVSANEIPIGQFSHLAGTWDGTTLRLYVNGVLNAQTTPGVSPVDSGCPFFMGGFHSPEADTCGYVGQFFNGLIDEVSYFNRALSAAEIQAIYGADGAGKCPPGVAPSIIAQPASQTVLAGSSATFTVAAAGTPPLGYQWRLNGTNLSGATVTSLTLSNVQPAQAGNYSLRVTNAFGSIISSNALLTVNSTPYCATPPAGLVSWWRAEGSAGDSVDSNNGALLNGASFAPGMVGPAFSFDGGNQCVQVPFAPSLVASNYSIEAWVKPLAQVSDFINQDLIFGQNYGHCQLVARTGTTGVRIAFQFGVSHYTFYGAVSANEIPIGQFSHLVGTWDGTTLRLYVNGVLNAQGAPGASPVDSGCPFFMGGFHSPEADTCGYVGQFFNGLIDEVSYFNRALSAAEIQAIYGADGAGKCPPGVAPSIIAQPASQTVLAGSSATFTVAAAGTPPLGYQWRRNGTNISGANNTTLTLTNVQLALAGIYTVQVTNPFGSATSSNAVLAVTPVPACAPPPAGLVSWWAAQNNALDSIGSNPGVLHNGVGFTSGEVGQAFRFNGTNSFVEVPDSPALRLTNQLTIEFWVKRQDLQKEDYIINKGGDYTRGMLNYGVTITQPQWGGTVAFTFAGGARHSLSITNLNWHHCAVTARNGDADPIFYVDGVQQPVTLRQGAPTIRLYASTAALDIGAQVDPASGWYYYSAALVDELSIYNRALAAAEIQAIYSAGSLAKCPPAVAPSIIAQPASQTVVAGAAATFTVTATGTAPLGYQWRLNGAGLFGQTKSSLTLTNVQMASAGSYSVLVTNLAGSVVSSNALLTVVPASTNCVPAPAGLVGWWAAEGNTLDGTGSNPGVSHNGVGFAGGVVGQAFVFNGSSNSFVEVPDSPTLRFTNALTIECWAKRLNTSEVHILVEKGGDWTGGQSNYELALNDTYFGGKHFGFSFAGGWRGCAVTPDTAWHHYAAVAVSGQANPILYIDGVPQTVTYSGGSATVHLPASTRPLHIGAQLDPQTGWFYYSSTMIDEPAIYSRALAASEILDIYNAGSVGKCGIAPVVPSIITQPASQTVMAGSPATFTVTAAGAPPLSYQWRFNGADLGAATASSLRLTNVQPASAGSYSVLVSNPFGSILSSNATLTVVEGAPNTLVNINFGAHQSPGLTGIKVGLAATGQSTNDFWNFYSRDDGHGNRLVDGALPNLKFANGSVSAAGLIMSNAPGCWANGSSDAMYNTYLYPFNSGNITATVTNLPAGQYDFYVYANDGNYQLTVGSTDYGIKRTLDVPRSNPLVWQEGRQYALFRGVTVEPGQTANLVVRPGQYRYAVISGMQIGAATVVTGTPPSIVAQPQSQTVGIGSNVTFAVAVSGTAPLSYQWRLEGTNLAGATGSALVLANVQPASAGSYSVLVSNTFGSILSSTALLTVNRFPVAQCADVIVSSGATCMADASINNGSADPDGDPITISQLPPGPYPLGTNRVTLTVTDDKGASNSCSALVIVLDRTPPVLVCPDGKRLEFQDETGAAATYSVTATDTCSAVSLVLTPPSGSVFPIGVTPVHVQATDGCNNSAQCSFTVTVLGAQGVKSNVLAELMALRSSLVLTEPFAQKFDEAIEHLANSLDPAHWIDQTHLQAKCGNTAMNQEKLAANKLREIMDAKGCPVEAAVLQGLIDRIVKCDRLLAIVSIQEAAKAGLNAKKVEQDLALVTKGDREAEAGHCANAIEHYRNAWRHALQLQLRLDLNADGTTRVQFVGNNSKSYRVEGSADMVNWTPLGTCTADGEGNVEITVPKAADQPVRFYRAIEE